MGGMLLDNPREARRDATAIPGGFHHFKAF
jgi:hypothetical protein